MRSDEEGGAVTGAPSEFSEALAMVCMSISRSAKQIETPYTHNRSTNDHPNAIAISNHNHTGLLDCRRCPGEGSGVVGRPTTSEPVVR